MIDYINPNGVSIHRDKCGISVIYRLDCNTSIEAFYPTLKVCLSELEVNHLNEVGLNNLLLFPKDLGFTD